MDDVIVLWTLLRFCRSGWRYEDGKYVTLAPRCLVSVSSRPEYEPVYGFSDVRFDGMNFKEVIEKKYFQTKEKTNTYVSGYYSVRLSYKGLNFVRKRVRQLQSQDKSCIVGMLSGDPVYNDLRKLIGKGRAAIQRLAGTEKIKLEGS